MLFTRIINLRFFNVSVSYITDFCSSKLTLYIDIKFIYTVNKGLFEENHTNRYMSSQHRWCFHFIESTLVSTTAVAFLATV